MALYTRADYERDMKYASDMRASTAGLLADKLMDGFEKMAADHICEKMEALAERRLKATRLILQDAEGCRKLAMNCANDGHDCGRYGCPCRNKECACRGVGQDYKDFGYVPPNRRGISKNRGAATTLGGDNATRVTHSRDVVSPAPILKWKPLAKGAKA